MSGWAAAVLRRRIQPGVIRPLVQHRGLERFRQLGHAVLGDDRRAEAGDQGVDAVVDLRVHMVGPACQHDDPAALLSGAWR